MQGLYKEHIRRPSLRFLQKFGNMERRSELFQQRKSARLSRILALRNIPNDLPDSLGEEEEKLTSQQENVAPTQTLASEDKKPPDIDRRRKAFLDEQKSKLARWKAEKDRKKAQLLNSKKPFVSCVHPNYDPPKFLASRRSSSHRETKSASKQTATGHVQKHAAALKPQNGVGKKGATKPANPIPLKSDVSFIKPMSSGVSFAPKNFKFTYMASLRNASKAKKGILAATSTPHKDAIGPRRSKRLASKDQAEKENSTFVVPKPPSSKGAKKVSQKSQASSCSSPNATQSPEHPNMSQNLIYFSP